MWDIRVWNVDLDKVPQVKWSANVPAAVRRRKGDGNLTGLRG
jgi:hypothetical protein